MSTLEIPPLNGFVGAFLMMGDLCTAVRFQCPDCSRDVLIVSVIANPDSWAMADGVTILPEDGYAPGAIPHQCKARKPAGANAATGRIEDR